MKAIPVQTKEIAQLHKKGYLVIGVLVGMDMLVYHAQVRINILCNVYIHTRSQANKHTRVCQCHMLLSVALHFIE